MSARSANSRSKLLPGPDDRAPAGNPRPSAAVIFLVVAVAVAGLTYGFLLGRGSGTGTDPPPIADETPTTVDQPSTSTTAPPQAVGESLPQGFTSFVRESPGHDLGPGVTEFLGLPEFQAIAVDAAGLVWVGGPTGLMHLDPATADFTPLTLSDGTGPLDVRAIAPEPRGSVWVATGRGLSHWDGDAWLNDSRFLSQEDRDLAISALAVGDDGMVWLATQQWESETWTETSQIHHDHAPFVGDIETATMPAPVYDLETAGAELWALVGGRLWRHTDFWKRVEVEALPLQEQMAVGTDGSVWLARGHRLRRWDGNELVEVAWNPPWSDPERPSEPGEVEIWIQQLTAGPDGSMWALVHRAGEFVASNRSSIVHLDGEVAIAYDVPELPPDDWPRSVAVAPDGNVWITAGSRVLRFDGADWSEFRSAGGDLPVRWISSLATGPDGDVWITGSTGILRVTGTEWRIYGPEEFGLSEDDDPELSFTEYWVAADLAGGIWGGVGCEPFRFGDEGWTALPPLPGSPEECWDLVAGGAPDGALWLGVGCCERSRPLYRFHDGAWHVTGTDIASDIDDLAFPADGTVWAAGGDGIARFSGGEWRSVFGGESFAAIAAAGDGSIWAAPHQWSDMPGGLWQYHEGAWEVTVSNRATWSLTRGPDGTVWALQDETADRTVLVNTATGRVHRVVDSGGLSAMAIAPDGTVWIGGDHRLYRVDAPSQ